SKRGVEGGQMPAYRRLPKLKGFQVYNKLNYAQINVGRIDALGLSEISLEALKEKLTIHPSCVGLRVLGNGEIKSAVTVKAAYVTPSAKEKIEAAGGKVELV
ncbi:MAG: 50S ribosomal protein L15, partial [Muribaculaceae bacterium]|nr:50S ribosomal protein L15 [Muribaculaceae bacterium]